MKKTVSLTSIITAVLLVTAMLLPQALFAGKMKTPVRFAIIGDRTGGHEPGIYPEIIKEIERLKPEFVMTVGDMIEGYTEDPARMTEEWEEYVTLVEPLTVPIYYTPGNHDITTDAMLEAYEKYIGDPYYSFNYKKRDIHIIVLDNSRYNTPEEIPADQIEWLKKDLKKNRKSAWTCVFMHKPLWFNGIAAGKPDMLHDIFRENGVDAVFTGHFHIYFSGEYDGVKYTSLGSSGGGTRSDIADLHYHFAWVTVDNDDIHIAPVKMGAVQTWDVVTAVEVHKVNEIMLSALSFDGFALVQNDLRVPGVPVKVVVKNVNTEISLADTIRWDTPEGWTVEPSTVPVTLEPGSSTEVTFAVNSDGVFYPLPMVKLECPVSPGRSYPAERPLNVARLAECYAVHQPPEIDANLDEPFWDNPVNRFFTGEGEDANTEPVQFYFAYDSDNIYLGAMCEDSQPEAIVANAVDQDGAVYAEDCVGYFLIPDWDAGDIYQVYFNPKGTVFDTRMTMNEQGLVTAVDREWNGQYEVSARLTDNGWCMEARIPLDQMNATAEPGDKWRLNFRRKQNRLNATADWQLPIIGSFGVLEMK